MTTIRCYNGTEVEVSTKTVWCGYTVEPKRDFGNQPHLIDGKWVSEGFVVTKGGVNVMPGATWFRTVEDALDGIAAYIVVDGDGDKFWALMRLAKVGKRKQD